jgi:hypothetical protein
MLRYTPDVAALNGLPASGGGRAHPSCNPTLTAYSVFLAAAVEDAQATPVGACKAGG